MPTFPRSLLPDERHILDVLLSRPFEGRDELKAQVAVVSVDGLSCACGCPSLALTVEPTAQPAPVHGMVAEGAGVDRDGNAVGVLLFVDDHGYMADVDVYARGGTVDGRATGDRWGMPVLESFELAGGKLRRRHERDTEEHTEHQRD
jgi:hypothetical protein